MVVEVNPMEASEKRKSTEANLRHRDGGSSTRSADDTASTKPLSTNAIEDKTEPPEQSKSPISMEFDLPKASIPQFPANKTVLPSKVEEKASSRPATPQEQPSPPTDQSTAVDVNETGSSQQTSGDPAERDTVDKVNRPLTTPSSEPFQAKHSTATNQSNPNKSSDATDNRAPFTGTTTQVDATDVNLIQAADKNPNSMSTEPPIEEDPLVQAREPLVAPYGSFIHPTDTCLDDARKRLRTALDQTRILRSAFSDRLYEKYRIVLKPVPETVQDIVDNIIADPSSNAAKLQQDIRSIREEKEIEKKEANKLIASNALGGLAETVEQLLYVGAGLDLVILPEDVATVSPTKYPHRGPINPETGLRVSGISQASAMAAETLLQRVRRLRVVRSDRQRRQQAGDDGSDRNSLSRHHLLSNTAAGVKFPEGQTGVAKQAKKRVSVSSSKTTLKCKVQPEVQGATILSLDPAVEDLNSEQSASTLALVSMGVGWTQARSHPHPESAGARRQGSLPQPPPKGDRRPLPVHDRTKVSTDRASKGLRAILSQFVGEVSIEESSDETNDDQRGKKRRATEIGLMHGLQQAEGDGKQSAPIMTNDPIRRQEVQPNVAFSVLHALGLIHDAPSRKDSDPPVSQRLLQISPALSPDLAQRSVHSSSKIISLYKKMTSKKRSFSEMFVSEMSACQQESGGATKGDSPQPESSARKPRNGKNFLADECASSNNNGKPAAADVSAAGERNQVDDCPVLSIRGGGGEEKYHDEVAGADDLEAPGSRPKSAPGATYTYFNSSGPMSSSSSSAEMFQSARPTSADGLVSFLTQNRLNADRITHHRSAAYALRANALSHLATSNTRLSGGSDVSNILNSRHWSGIVQSPQSIVNLMPHQTTLASLGLHPHQAAMLEFSARDRAARALLAREQHAAAHAAAVQASAMRGSSTVAGLPAQHAAALLGNPIGGPGLFASQGSPQYNQLSVDTPTNVFSAPATLVGQSQIFPTGTISGPLTHYPPDSNNDSRPNSQHSTSSSKSGKAKRPTSSKGRKLSIQDSREFRKVSASLSDTAEKREGGPAAKRKAEEIEREVKATDEEISPPLVKDKEVIKMSSEDNSQGREDPSPRKQPRIEEGQESVEGKGDSKQQEAATKVVPELTQRTLENTSSDPSPELDDEAPKDHQHENSATESPSSPGMQLLQFFVPPIPPALDVKIANFVLQGRIHSASSDLFLDSGELRSVSTANALLDFLQAVGSSVPIPKALISGPLKDRLNVQNIKTSGNSGNIPSIPREVVIATILVWLWVQHKASFQRAFGKSGRIDVDPECKWLIQAAVDSASRAVMAKLVETLQNGGPLASALSSSRSKGGVASSKSASGEGEKPAMASVTVDLRFAMITNEALMTELCIDDEVDSVLPMYDELVQLLDETRLEALRGKCRERVYLAAILARHSTMAEPFANSYVSCMVRAGEALGHGELFELVQDEDASTSTMIPYDIFSDETGAWEDPCRPPDGFTPNLAGEDLVRRAHARAMILKSLNKMQRCCNFKGGTDDAGPYSEVTSQSQTIATAAAEARAGLALQRTPSGSMKRRTSFSLPETAVQPGTGFALANSINQYNPKYTCVPLFWDVTSIENKPYGKHAYASRPRAFSMNTIMIGNEEPGEPDKRGRSRSTSPPHSRAPEPTYLEDDIPRSTEEIAWSDVARAFEIVNMSGGGNTPRSKRRSSFSVSSGDEGRDPTLKTIIAPFCHRIDDSEIPQEDSGDSEGEEDLSDEAILARHQVVLDKMKERLDRFMEGRTTAGQRARQRAKARAAEKAALADSSMGK